MTDGAIDPSTFVHPDDELVFDDEIELVPPPPKAEATPARKAPRKGRAAEPGPPEPTPSAAVPETVAEEPADAPAPVPRPDAATVGSDPLPRERVPLLLAAIVAFALLTSLISLGGLIAVGRSLAATNAAHDRAAEQAEAMTRVPAMVRALDTATARLATLAAATPPTTIPATADDVRGAVDGLRMALSQRQPESMAPIAGTLHDGFSEIDTRLGRIENRMGSGTGRDRGPPRHTEE